PQPAPTKVNVYPNPTQGATMIDLDLSNTQNVLLELYDLSGRQVATLIQNSLLSAGQYRYEWSCEQLLTGMYLVVLNGKVIDRLVVQQ
ncbi:MAG: T9SS type A sorting domain-containing protein, partial [Saprospiraceae bacterium]